MNLRSVKSSKIFNAMMILPILIGLFSAFFTVYVFWWPPKAAYEIQEPGRHRISYQDGVLRIHRMYCINYSTPITISRDLIQIDSQGQSELRVMLPQTTHVYKLGCHEVDRMFELPKSTPPGVYKLLTTATWQANPFRDDHAVLPELDLVVPVSYLKH